MHFGVTLNLFCLWPSQLFGFFLFFLLSKIVNATWFQDIADLTFRSSQGRPLVNLSISVMIADTVFSIVVEIIFLVQGKVFSMVPIKIIGAALNLLHNCLLHSLYSFEYK